MKVLSVSNRKGGVGKSTFSCMCATLLFHLVFAKKVKLCIVDFDEQKSTMFERQEELRNKEKIGKFKTMFPSDYQERGKKLYPVYCWSYRKYLDNYEDLEKNFNYVFLEFPGRIDDSQAEVLETLDRTLIPVVADKPDIRSTMTYVKACYRLRITSAWFLNRFSQYKFQQASL